MTRFLPVVCLILWGLGLSAQPIITNASFPSVGDTLKTVFDGVPSGIVIGPKGADQSWDFSTLQGLTRETIIAPASSGDDFASFPNAEILTDLDLLGEIYLNKTTTRYEQLGYSGADPVGFGLDVLVRFSPPILDRRAPMNYDEINNSNSSIKLPLGADQLPGAILDSLPISPDSVRIRIEINRSDEVEAWGKLTIPGGTYEVLREKRIEIRETFIDTKINPLPWIDITSVVAGVLPFLGKDTLVSYHYYSEGIKAPIAVASVNSETEEIQTVEYLANDDVVNNVSYIDHGKADVFAYPNPAIEDVRFEFLNLKKGKYRLVIYNILGVEVWNKYYNLTNSRTTKVDLADFRKGTYLYSLIDEKGKTITTKRLIIIRP